MKLVLSAIFFLLIGGFMAWHYGTSILSDWDLADRTLVPATEAQITEAECKVRLGFWSSCDVGYQRGAEKGELRFMVFADLGNKSVRLMTAPDQPGSLTTDVGIEYLTNRILTLAGFVGFCALLAIGGVIGLLRGKR